MRAGKQPQDWTPDELRQVAPEFDSEAVQLLSARRTLENHTALGGTAPGTVAESLRQAEKRLAEMRKLL